MASELPKLHERIAVLEGQLRELDRPVQHAPSWSWVVLGMAIAPMGAMLLVGFGLVVAAVREPPPPLPRSYDNTEYLKPTKTKLYAQWYPQTSALPIVRDINGDGHEDIIGLGWTQTATGGKPLMVVAFDGATFEPIWHTGGFRGTWHSEVTHLVEVNGQLLLTDASDELHVLDPMTGKQAATTMPFPKGAELVCPEPGSSVFLVNSATWGEDTASAFDITTGASLPVPKGRRCTWMTAHEQTERMRGGMEGKAFEESRWSLPAEFAGAESYESHGVVVSVGHRYTVRDHSQSEAYAAAWDKKTKKALWHHVMTDVSDAEHPHARYTLVDADSVLTMYQAEGTPRLGPFRVVSWSLTTGEKQWAATLPQSAEGSWMGAFGEHGDRVFALTNTGMHVLDRKTGAVLASLEDF